MRRALPILFLMTIMVAVVGQAQPVAHYTTHATGEFNGDGHADMIIVCTSGRAFLLLGTGGGFDWKSLVVQAKEAVEKPDGWPQGSALFVKENGKGFDVFTRDVRGQLSRFSTAAVKDVQVVG